MTKAAKPLKMESWRVVEALRTIYASPRYAFLEQVANGTGSQAGRWIDAFALSIWPSMGFEALAFEVKVSRGDWRRERDNPAKADEIGKRCHRFFVAAPTGVVPIEEVPAAWGVIEVDAAGVGFIRRQAEKLTPPEPSWGFVAAILRRASDAEIRRRAESVPMAEVNDRVDKEAATKIQSAVKQASYIHETEKNRLNWELSQLKASVEVFERTTGLKLPQWPDQARSLGELVKQVRELGPPERALAEVRRRATDLLNHSTRLEQVLKELPVGLKGLSVDP